MYYLLGEFLFMHMGATGGSLTTSEDGQVACRLELLFEAGRRLSRSLEPKDLFATFTSLVSEVMPCDGLLVSSYSAIDDSIRCEYAWVNGEVQDHSAFPLLTLNRDGTGMQSQVILEAKPMLFDVVGKVRARPDGHYREMGEDGTLKPLVESDPSAKWALMCPMMLDDQVTGVVQVMSDSGRVYREDDLHLLQMLVFQLSPTVQNSFLYTRLKQELHTRESAEKALTASEHRFRTLVESMPLIAWATDGATRERLYVNGFYADYVGVHPSELDNIGWNEVVHEDDRARGLASVTRAYESGQAWEEEIRLRRADGAYRWHLSRMVPIRDEAGEIELWLGTSTDIHEQKEAEAELERRVAERTRQLELAIRELEGFTYSVSHDLRSPLRAIIATSVMLQQDFGPDLAPEVRSLLNRQANAAKRLAVLIDDLLHLSRIGRQEMQIDAVDLTGLVSELILELRAEGRANNVRFEVQPNMSVCGDSRLLRLALMNLLDNAAKFSPSGGTVKVTKAGDTICVADEGIGLDMAYADRLFRPFERLVSDSDFPGTGIGLANVLRIVERHGGTIWVESELGKGARFHFTLAPVHS